MPSERSRLAELFGNDDSSSSVDDADMGACGGVGDGGANVGGAVGGGDDNSLGTTMPIDSDDSTDMTLENRLRRLYPMVESPSLLPTMWNVKDKYQYIGLSDDCLTVQYKGHGKDHTDAASVRADNPIPASCGLYYFEVTIISKGRDGYFGIGLSTDSVSLNRLPGWDRMSYGYHGDDGHSFCSSGTGKSYGPTFSTGDVIGCGVNLVDNSCFYTKNGINLGTAFTDLPPSLYPTVGLQTPGEVLEANFGQSKFLYDVEDAMHGLRAKTHASIRNFPVANDRGQWNTMLQKMVLMYLMHHGYVSSAEAFAQATNQPFEEEIASVKNRQQIQRLILTGRVGDAISLTQDLYPGLLEFKPDLLFMLKTRQFIEMISGCDPEVGGDGKARWQRFCSMLAIGKTEIAPGQLAPAMSPPRPKKSSKRSKTKSAKKSANDDNEEDEASAGASTSAWGSSASSSTASTSKGAPCPTPETDVEMMDCNENSSSSTGSSDSATRLGKCNGAIITNGKRLPGLRPPPFLTIEGLNKTLAYGRELKSLSMKMRAEYGHNSANKRMLEEACSLLAYSNPYDSPLSYLLAPSEREPICRALNSAIMERLNLPPHPSLEMAVCQANQLLRTMSSVGMGACAFASLPDVLKD